MNTITEISTTHHSFLSSFPVKKFYSKFKMYLQNRRTRKHLSELSDHLLEDVGITQSQVNEELRKPFWK
ncbi:MAG: DUF1127 domain-containing protein [Vibrio toranzoniae]|jgi:uncharacterized protein YjiS (DUF1127 family)|uniref:YjiS-like domain-containing protein n=1 Tax=Vibrio toranzoniae TaxID=1194427 RepID=A0A109D830_9VIBR|nr:DUF1127 domain-containing protein [Vibrio toranzoniae]KWU00517.1 hypothetical protein APQ14_10460 [Vibrio toranzoniae]NAZ91294.1 DUF1127 domain-containing protein [Vibrio toranzoniae]SBS35693.1 hypothetical protein VTO7225_02295 [Vibrio toranzoniae]